MGEALWRVDKVLRELRGSKQAFWDNCKDVGFENKGISNIEAFYLWSFIGRFKPDIVFESGVYRGRSTEIVARACRHFGIPKHIAVDVDGSQEEYTRKKLEGYDVEYVIMDGAERFAEIPKDKSVFCFVDGPKRGEPFFNLVNLITTHSKWRGIVCHDCKPGSSTRRALKQCRKGLSCGLFRVLSPEDSSDLNDLNVPYWEWYRKMGKKSEEKQHNRMPCIGVWLNV